MTTARETDRDFVIRILNTIHNPSTTKWDYAELKELCDRLLAADAKLNEPVEIKRYDHHIDGRDDDLYSVMEEDKDGAWVSFEDHVKAMRARVPDINKKQLCEKFTEIVALRLDVLDQRIYGVWPPNTDLGRWRNRYIGRRHDELPPFTVELNHFKNEVDQFVAMLMFAIDDVAASTSPGDEK